MSSVWLSNLWRRPAIWMPLNVLFTQVLFAQDWPWCVSRKLTNGSFLIRILWERHIGPLIEVMYYKSR